MQWSQFTAQSINNFDCSQWPQRGENLYKQNKRPNREGVSYPDFQFHTKDLSIPHTIE